MAHQQQIDFCISVKKLLPIFFKNKFVLDVGSLDINGNNQYLFDDCLYLGIDLLPGKNVDLATKGHELNLPDASIDVIVSTECFEHDQFYALTLNNILRMVKPGGLFIFSCATTGRPEHGTRRTTPADAPFTHEFGEWSDYYKNLEEDDIRDVLDVDSIFEKYDFSINLETFDLYFWGVKKGTLIEREDYSFQVQQSSLSLKLNAQETFVNELLGIVCERDNRITNLSDIVAASDKRIASLVQALVDREGQIAGLSKAVADQDEQIADLSNAAIERDERMDYLSQAVAERDIKMEQLISSNSWRLTKPLRFTTRLLRGEIRTAMTPLLGAHPTKLRAWARIIYHKLPLSQKMKFHLRERMHPIVAVLQHSPSVVSLSRAVVDVISGGASGSVLARDHGREQALVRIIADLALHASKFGQANNWIALPFLSTGGAEMVALNLCKALREISPEQSVVLMIIDRRLISDQMVLPPGVALIVFDDYLGEDLSYSRKQALLRDLLVSVRPQCFHNINSEVAWHLILAEGDRLKRIVRLYASIFAFQFAPDKKTKIGYAAYFLKQGMPHLSGLISDNRRFLDDAIIQYDIDVLERARMWAVYQPCRLLTTSHGSHFASPLSASSIEGGKLRPQILWAGRLDAEKRVDLFLDIVRRCDFADFYIFGQVVLDGESVLPLLPNLNYEGPFTSPLEWIEKYHFDAFLFTSKWEGMPNILIEVGALSIPVIAPTVGGVGELITEKTGYPLPELPSVDDYVAAMTSIISSPEEARERSKSLLKLIEFRHSWPAFVAAVVALPGYVGTPDFESLEEKLAIKIAENTTHNSPIVSVIIPCYNQGRYLHECIASVLSACHSSIEIIVIDDGSTDEKIERYLTEVVQMAPDVVRVHRQKNQGLSCARNSGIDLARGEFIQFLDSDDLLVPGKIDAQLAQLAINSHLDVSICNFLLCDESRSVYSKPDEAIAKFDLSLQDFLYRWERGFSIPIHCGLFRRRAIAGSYFDTHARAKEDWLFWIGLTLVGARFGYIHGHWAIYRQHDSSMRRSYLNMGRSWLQAGLKIDTMLAGREPLFLETMIAWFEQCYRANPGYQSEIAELHKNQSCNVMASGISDVTVSSPGGDLVISASTTIDPNIDAVKLLKKLSIISDVSRPPLVSIIIPIYGHYEYLEACLLSVVDQGNTSIEIICIDDASPDPRVSKLMHEISGKLERLKIIVHSLNCGISVAQNTAVSIANGDYVAFLDCDDMLESGALAIITDQIRAHPDVDYFFSNRHDIDEKGQLIRTACYGGYENLHFSGQENIRKDLLDGMVASHLKVIRRSEYLKANGCNPKFSGVQDWDLALKIAEQGKFYYINQVLYRHRVHRNSVTSSDLLAQFRKSNIVRRHHCNRWLTNESIDRESIRFFSKSNFPVELDVLKTSWKQGYRCIADATGSLNISQINFLREFNSYFDKIDWDDPAVPASLIGYLWDPLIIDLNQSLTQLKAE